MYQKKWDDRMGALFGCLGLIALVLAVMVLGGFVVSWAWNETMPYIFELPTITWQQGIFLNFLSWFLIKATPTNWSTSK
jgi:type IV secretory pathway TrbF-like protein